VPQDVRRGAGPSAESLRIHFQIHKERTMSTPIQALALAALLLGAGACNKEDANAAKNKAQDAAHQAGESMAAGWDKLTAELDEKSVQFKKKVADATPEAKAKLQGLQDTFNEKLALAKQKFAEAKAAAPEKMEALKKEAEEAVEAAKRAWDDAFKS
jgi:hypothetical protein